MSRAYNERNKRALRFTAAEYAQMRRLVDDYGWTLRGIGRQVGIREERDKELHREMRRTQCGG